MEVHDFVAFSSWSIITAVSILVISLVYRKFTKKPNNEPSSH